MDINAILDDLQDQRDRINRAIDALEGTKSNGRRGRAGVQRFTRVMEGNESGDCRLQLAGESLNWRARWAKAKKAGRNQL